MILDYINNYATYKNVISNFDEAFQFAFSLKDKAVGKYELNEDVFAMVQEGDTEDLRDGKFEYHKKYIDVQIVVSGEETVEWQDLSRLEEAIPYKEDAGFMVGTGEVFQVKEGMFYIVFPHDGHKPCRHIKEQTHYKKIVLKIKL